MELVKGDITHQGTFSVCITKLVEYVAHYDRALLDIPQSQRLRLMLNDQLDRHEKMGNAPGFTLAAHWTAPEYFLSTGIDADCPARFELIDLTHREGFCFQGYLEVARPDGIRRYVVTNADTPVITLCGSTRFGHLYAMHMLDETLRGRMVFGLGTTQQSDADLFTHEQIRMMAPMFDHLHREKIDRSHGIFVMNGYVDGREYCGKSTIEEVKYAVERRLDVRWVHPHTCVDPDHCCGLRLVDGHSCSE